MYKTDILIIGAGPVGLFTVFEAGLLKLKCHLVDALPIPGGQLSEIYPKKPIYDIPGYPSVLAGELVDKLMEQIAPFKPEFTLGLGCFEPRKPPIEGIDQFEDKGVDYMVKDPEKFRNKKLLIAGGGDSALDWTIELADIASEITLIHRRTSFRGALDSVDKVMELAQAKKVNLITEAQAIGVNGNGILKEVMIRSKADGEFTKQVDNFIPLFGLSPKLGPIADWGLNIDRSAIEVNTSDYSTNVPGIYAIGDINTYPGKLKLILCGFHEGTLMVQSAFKYIYPDAKLSFKYTTVAGVNGFE